ncbi:hypothetical protein [Bifidobacterium aerophilum]|nr:hypothetical protein [Bifidobacterium aerophilum]
MRKVAEHREDKYSPSLHLVGMNDGTRFSDEHTPQAKGIIMQPDTKYTSERIAHVRQLRRAAIRRRRMIVVSLLAVTVVVLAISFPLKFSPLFALIPAAMMLAVIGLGVRAAAQAREWERKVAASRKAKAARKPKVQTVVEPARRAVEQPADRRKPAAVPGNPANEPVTDVMEQREIRRALEQARKEQAAAFAQREARRAAEREAAKAAVSAVAQSAASDVASAEEVIDTTAASVEGSVEAPAAQDSQQIPQPAAPRNSQTASVEPAAPADETSELAHVSPSRALDAFEMASQDLISFSLGAPRNGVEPAAPAPESLEIKSTKQVAKAVPAAQNDTDTANAADVAASDGAETSASAETQDAVVQESPSAVSDAVNDTAAFHDSEERVEVDAPEATSDSLGTGLEAILARRSA